MQGNLICHQITFMFISRFSFLFFHYSLVEEEEMKPLIHRVYYSVYLHYLFNWSMFQHVLITLFQYRCCCLMSCFLFHHQRIYTYSNHSSIDLPDFFVLNSLDYLMLIQQFNYLALVLLKCKKTHLGLRKVATFTLIVLRVDRWLNVYSYFIWVEIGGIYIYLITKFCCQDIVELKIVKFIGINCLYGY